MIEESPLLHPQNSNFNQLCGMWYREAEILLLWYFACFCSLVELHSSSSWLIIAILWRCKVD